SFMKNTAKIISVALLGSLILALATQASLAARPRRPHQTPSVDQGKKTPAAEQPKENTTRYGAISITNWNRTSGSLDFTSVTYTGPNTRVEVPDKSSGSHLSLHADEIKLIGINKPGTERVELRGHLTYSLTQPTPDGPRKLAGTAGQGDYRSEAKRIVLSSGV